MTKHPSSAIRKIFEKISKQFNDSSKRVRIVFPEGWNPQIQLAVKQLQTECAFVDPVLVFRTNVEMSNCQLSGIEKISIESYDLFKMSTTLYEMRKAKGMTPEEALALVKLPNYFCTMLIAMNIVDGYVGGIEMTTKDTLKPSLQIIKTSKQAKIVTSGMIMEKGDEVYVWGDCAIVVEPTAEELKEIAKVLAQTSKDFGLNNTDVAMLSYSTAGSGAGPSSDKVRQALSLLQSDPEFIGRADFEYQFDAAYVNEVRSKKAPKTVFGQKPTCYVFPNLDAGNIGYKIAQRMGGYQAIGPFLMGLAKPVNDLSRGASVEDIVGVTYITMAQVYANEKK